MRNAKYTLLVVMLLFGIGIWLLYPSLKIATGFAAKNLCSCVFVGKMTEEQVLSEDLGNGPVAYTSSSIDYNNQLATSSIFGLQTQTAVYREGLGCALIHNVSAKDARKIATPNKTEVQDSLKNWFDAIDTVQMLTSKKQAELETALAWAFEEEEGKVKNTRAAVIIYKGQLIGEQYAEGFDRNSRFQGWSMTKSITAMMYGILSDNGALNVKESLSFLNEPSINILHLLQMSSGLEWDENYVQRSSVTKMLFESDTVAMSAMQTQLSKEPGTFWEYSSGTTNLLAYGLRQWLPDDEQYVNFPYDSIFNKIGAYSMVMEPDASGHFVGSSYSWATARDWAKIGTLLYNDGQWNGEEIISTDWVNLMRAEAPASNGLYGGQVWLNKGGKFSTLPKDAYSLDGFNGQKVMIVPSKDLVIVRMGLTFRPGDFDFDEWFGLLLEAIDD